MSLLRRALAPMLERRAQSDPFSIPAPGAIGQMSLAGTVVTDDSALSIMTFFAGVRLIADTAAMTPVRAVTQSADGTRTPLVVSPDQITSPFHAFSLQEGISQIVTSLILRGNAYLVEVLWNAAGKPVKWRILNPDQVDVQWGPDGLRRYRINGAWWELSPVVHLTGFMIANSLTGVGIIEYCRNALGLGIALDDVAGNFFRNGIQSTGVIGVDAPLTQDEARSVAEQFASRHAGMKSAHLPVVMGGGAKYTPISLTPEDAQFIQSRQFQQGQIATLLGIPPHLLGMVEKTSSWGTGIEVLGRVFVDYTMRFFFTRLETMFTSWLDAGTFSEFVTDAITRADTTTRYINYQRALTDGWMNKDEVRLREGLPPLPDGAGQIYYTPMAQIPASNQQGLIASAPAAPIPAANPSTGAAS